MTKQEVKLFREDFQKAVAQLEEQYGVNISLGTIRNVGAGQVGGLFTVTPII